jgi:hypothetical protein
MSIVLSPAVGINTLHCGSCWLFQNVWELTQTHCIVDDTVGIDCFHCEQHCSALGAFLSCVFFLSKITVGGLAFSVKSCWVWLDNMTQHCWAARPKTLPKGAKKRVGSGLVWLSNSIQYPFLYILQKLGDDKFFFFFTSN